jgi:hypothetical protein
MAPYPCGCDPEKIDAVHAFLTSKLPKVTLRDFHHPAVLLPAGIPPPHRKHHAISVQNNGVSCHVVLTHEFLDCNEPHQIATHMCEHDLIAALAAPCVSLVVVTDDGVEAY